MKRFLRWFKSKLHRCTHDGCWEKGEECYLPGWPCEEDESGPPPEWVCHEHMFDQGYCWGCRTFHGSIEDFEFGSGKLCHECRHEMGNEHDWEHGDPDEDSYWGDTP